MRILKLPFQTCGRIFFPRRWSVVEKAAQGWEFTRVIDIRVNVLYKEPSKDRNFVGKKKDCLLFVYRQNFFKTWIVLCSSKGFYGARKSQNYEKNTKFWQLYNCVLWKWINDFNRGEVLVTYFWLLEISQGFGWDAHVHYDLTEGFWFFERFSKLTRQSLWGWWVVPIFCLTLYLDDIVSKYYLPFQTHVGMFGLD